MQIRGQSGPVIRLSASGSGSGVLAAGGDEARNVPSSDKPRNQWNRMRITARGERVIVRVNDTLVTDDAQVPGMAREGAFALRHGGPIEFANIYVRELK